MFCYLYKMTDRTGIEVFENEKCEPTCISCNSDGTCKLGRSENIHLSDGKFGWMIEDHIFFNPPKESSSKLTKYIAAISLIHPAESDVWIIFYKRFYKKNNEWCTAYKYVQNNEMKDFDNLNALNVFLLKAGYNGRKLTESDFLIMK